MPLAALQRSKPTTKTRAQPKPAHAVISQSTTPSTTLHPIVQAKLRVGAPNDNYEREADRVADQVVREQGPAPESTLDSLDSPETVQRKCAACSSGGSGLCPECEEELQRHARKENDAEEEEEEILPLQTKEIFSQVPEVTPDLASRIHALRGGGKPLPDATRAFFEPRFGSDFSHVRVHADARAAAAARAVNARAFTVGPDIVFGGAQYAPGTTEGRQLLAHELTHVVQQFNPQPYIIQQKTAGKKNTAATSKDGRIFRQPADAVAITSAAATLAATVQPLVPPATAVPVYITGGGTALTVIEGGAAASAGGAAVETTLGSTSIAGGGLVATIGEPVIAIGFPIAMVGATTYMIYETAEAQQALTYSLDLKWLTRFGQESVVWLTGKRYLSEEEQVVWQRQIDEWAQNPEFIKKYHQLVDLLAAGVPLQDIRVQQGGLAIVAGRRKRKRTEDPDWGEDEPEEGKSLRDKRRAREGEPNIDPEDPCKGQIHCDWLDEQYEQKTADELFAEVVNVVNKERPNVTEPWTGGQKEWSTDPYCLGGTHHTWRRGRDQITIVCCPCCIPGNPTEFVESMCMWHN